MSRQRTGAATVMETRVPSLKEYLAKPYHLVLVESSDDDGLHGWVAEVEELPGCISQGATPDEAVDRIRDGMAGWISVALEDGIEIPEPYEHVTYSGKFMVRVPPSLHAALSRHAAREGVSLNQYVTAALAGAIGWPT